VDQNLKPWISVKEDILVGVANEKVKAQIDFILSILFAKTNIDEDQLSKDFHNALLSSGSVHGDKKFS
jgi:superfamily II DNA/RNA helicase